MTLCAKANGYGANVSIDGVKRTSASVTLARGQSIVVHVVVTAQAGNTKDYYITVSRL